MMEVYKKLAVTFLSALAVTLVVGGVVIFAEDDEPDYYAFNDATYLFDAKFTFHASMNSFFNDKISEVASIISEDEKFFENENFITPEDDDCEGNVSSYCVAMQATDLYFSYRNKLSDIKEFLPELPDNATKETALNSIGNRDEKVDVEVDEALKVVEATIIAYDEFKTALPMHNKFRQLIRLLNKFKIHLEDVNDQVKEFPLRFVDASSSTCE